MPDLERTLQPIAGKISEGFRVLLLNGQRQVGKSTLLSNMSKGTKRGYVSLDNMAVRKLAQTDPELFLQQNPPPVIIDEVQYAPSLFPYIKIYADSHRDDKGAFWLTGSQKYKLMQGVQESPAGRIAIIDMLGLSYREKIKRPFSGKPFVPSMEKQDMEKLTVRDVYKLNRNQKDREPGVKRLQKFLLAPKTAKESRARRDYMSATRANSPLPRSGIDSGLGGLKMQVQGERTASGFQASD